MMLGVSIQAPARVLMRRLQHGESAQSVIEMAFTLPILLLIIMGIIDFGFALSDRVALSNAARNGVRYATTHSTAWSNSNSPPANTIEGAILSSGGTSSIPNDDQHITIAYQNPDGSACGQYSAASNSFTGGSQSTCVTPQNLIQVTVSYTYSPITPGIGQLFPQGMILASSATMVEEQ